MLNLINVSIIIPIYNVERYLAQCLKSVTEQSLKEIEIICINDCSTDASLKILNDFQKKDARIIITNNQRNLGLASTRNRGIKLSQGNYIFFLDSDDMFFNETSLEHLYNLAINDIADEVIGTILHWDEQTNKRSLSYHRKYLYEEVHHLTLEEFPNVIVNQIACNKLIKRSLLKNNNLLFNEKLRKYEDTPLAWQIHTLAKAISITKTPTYLYRQRKPGGTPSIMAQKKDNLKYHLLAAKDIISFLSCRSLPIDIRHIFDRYIFNWIVSDCRDCVTGQKNVREVLASIHEILSNFSQKSIRCFPKKDQQIIKTLLTNHHNEEIWDLMIKQDSKIQQLYNRIKNFIYWRVLIPLRLLTRKKTKVHQK